MPDKKRTLGAWLLNAPKGVVRTATFTAAAENEDDHLIECELRVDDTTRPRQFMGKGRGDTSELAFEAAYHQLTDWLCDLGDAG